MAAIPFQSARFDLVTSFDVMQYVADDYAVMREMARVLKPGGALVVTAAALDVLRGGHAGTWPEVRRYTTREDALDCRERRDEGRTASRICSHRCFRRCWRCGLSAAIRARVATGPAGEDWEMRVPAAPINAALTWILRRGSGDFAPHPDARW